MAPEPGPEATNVSCHLSGALTVEQADIVHEQLQTSLAEAIRAGHPLRVDVSSADSADLTVLQLLLATARQAAEAGLEVSLEGLPGTVGKSAETAGLAEHPLFKT